MSESEDFAQKVARYKEKGLSEDEISILLDAQLEKAEKSIGSPVDASNEYNVASEGLPPSHAFSYDPDSEFKKDPEKPEFFERQSPVAKFVALFRLNSSRTYTLNGQTKKVKKMNVHDTMRVMAKFPKWMAYLDYNVPNMLIDQISGRQRILETITVILNRAFGEWDYKLDRPTGFSYSVLEEVARLLEVQDSEGQTAEDYLLSCDPEELFDALAKLVENNQGFFTKLWNISGPIKETWSLISGTISSVTKPIKEKLLQLKAAWKQMDKSSSDELPS